MTGKLEVSLDKLPIKRPDLIEENGLEQFPPDVGYEEKWESLIRRIDFAWEVEKDEEKKKKKKWSRESSAAQWELQSTVENLHLPHQESSPSLSISSTLWKLEAFSDPNASKIVDFGIRLQAKLFAGSTKKLEILEEKRTGTSYFCLSSSSRARTLSYMWIQKIVKDASRGGWSWRMVL